MHIIGRENSPYYDSMVFFHFPVLIFGTDAAREVARQPIIMLKVLGVIMEAGGSAFKKIVWKRDEISCIFFSNNTPDSQKDTYF